MSYENQVKEFSSLDTFYQEPLIFLQRRPLELVFNILKLRGGAASRGHYGDAAQSYCYRLNNRMGLEAPKRFQDGSWNVFFGYDSGHNGMEDKSFPYLTFHAGEFVAGDLKDTLEWGPGMKALLDKK